MGNSERSDDVSRVPNESPTPSRKQIAVSFLRRNLKIVVPFVLLGAAGIAWLAFGYFGVQFLFIDDEVNEAGPVFDSGAVAVVGGTAGADADISVEEPSVEEPAVEEPAVEEPAVEEPSVEEPAVEEPSVEEPVIETLVTGDFIDRAHPTSGVASVLTDGSPQRFLRFDDFETDNGPDLNVYLTSADATENEGLFDDDFIDLGNLKGNIGSQNYEIPPEVDLDLYDTVVIWCVRFSVAFGAADLG